MELERFEDLLRAERDGELNEDERQELLRACAEDNDLNLLRERDRRLQVLLTYDALDRAPSGFTETVMAKVREEKSAAGAAVDEQRPGPTPASLGLQIPAATERRPTLLSRFFSSRPAQWSFAGAVALLLAIQLGVLLQPEQTGPGDLEVLEVAQDGGADAGDAAGEEDPVALAMADPAGAADENQSAGATPDSAMVQEDQAFAVASVDSENAIDQGADDGRNSLGILPGWQREQWRESQLASLGGSRAAGGVPVVPVMFDAGVIPGFAPAASLNRLCLAMAHDARPATDDLAIAEIDLGGVENEPAPQVVPSRVRRLPARVGDDSSLAFDRFRAPSANEPSLVREIEMVMSEFGNIEHVKDEPTDGRRIVILRTTPSQLRGLQEELASMGLASPHRPIAAAEEILSGGEMRVIKGADHFEDGHRPTGFQAVERPITAEFHILPNR